MQINAFNPYEWIRQIAMSDWLSNKCRDATVMQSTNQIMYGTRNVISHKCHNRNGQQSQSSNVQTQQTIASTKLTITAKQQLYAMERSTIDDADYLQRHKTKAKHWHIWHPYKFLLVITIAFAMLHNGGGVRADDVTSLVRVPDDDDDGGIKHNNQKYADMGITTDPLVRSDDASISSARNNPALYSIDKLGSNLEMSIAAVFNKVAYGTTTKRSISDSVSMPSLTTVPTPQLTTFRYREKDNAKENDHKVGTHHQYSQHLSYQKHSNFKNKYPLDLEHDHALPTSAPNADILKSNSNPTYPNPNRHHNHGERHRIHMNSTPSPAGHNLLNKGQATIPMYPAEIPSYSPPARSFLTPRVPPEYPQNPFAEQPTLRGTNSESGLSSNFNINRRPIPPPSLMPGHEKIPLRPPDLVNGAAANGDGKGKQLAKDADSAPNSNNDSERKKVLNTPAQKYNSINANATNPSVDVNKIHFPSISRILSGSNGMNGDIPEILLKTVTARPTEIQSEAPAHAPEKSQSNDNASDKIGDSDEGDFSHGDDSIDEDTSSEDDFDSTTFNAEEPKTQPKIKNSGTTAGQQRGASTKKAVTEVPAHQSDMVYSTQIIQNLAGTNTNNNDSKKAKQPSKIGDNDKITNERSTLTTWAVAWNIHVYLTAILFTMLAVLSIFKIVFYNKLTHLVSQKYFFSMHFILIVICLARIFFLCFDAYNIHYSFPLFISELLLNLPATLLTTSFAILILFLLLRSLNSKNNRYSALMRPITIIVGSSVQAFLCITLHLVESHSQQQRNQLIQNQQQLQRAAGQLNANQAFMYNTPPRVLSLICQLIYIFICFSLGFFYLYVYKVLKRVLQKKSQNYIHGYQNLSYAIHITIATALLFILLAALQIYGAVSISTTRPIMSSLSDNDWLQWGYQFSMRLIEIAIIALLSWVTGLKTGTTKVLQRDKVMEQHNVSGFALFPCTSSSSQEHFETDYPAICNANTNLHSYTLRTGKPIYDDTFALNSLGMENGPHGSQMGPPSSHGSASHQTSHHLQQHHHAQFSPHKSAQDYQVQSMGDESGIYDAQSGTLSKQTNRITPTYNDARSDHLNDSGTIPDHYENPNFELAAANGANAGGNYRKNMQQSYMDNCYTEPIGAEMVYNAKMEACGYDFQNFERPSYAERNMMGPGSSATEFRASKNLKALNKANGGHYDGAQMKQNNLGAGKHYNPQTHSYNSFDRRGIRKSASSTGGRGNALSTLNLNSASQSSRTRTLNAPRNSQYDAYHAANNMHRSGAGRSSNNSCATSKAGHRNNCDEFDTVSQTSSSEGVRAYNPDMVIFKAQEVNVDAAQNSASSGDSSTSMLVAEHGFVRFRPMDIKDEKRAKRAAAAAAAAAAEAQQSMPSSASSNSDNNNINKNSPAIVQRHHKRSLT